MRTFSGKPQNIINESIASSVGAGRTSIVDDFKKWLDWEYKGKFIINDDDSINFTTDDPVVINNRDLPVRIICVDTLNIVNCPTKAIALPVTGHAIYIEKCNNLEELIAPDGCEVDELYIVNCPKLKNISTFTKAKLGRVKIMDCPITGVESLTTVEKSLYIKNCTDIKTFDYVNKNPINIKIERCKINSFPVPFWANKLELISVTRTKSLEIEIAQAIDVSIKDHIKTTDIIVKGKPVDTMVIDSCAALKKLTIQNDCRQSLSLCNLPEIEEYDICDIKGHCVTEKVNAIPQIKCKRMINRK